MYMAVHVRPHPAACAPCARCATAWATTHPKLPPPALIPKVCQDVVSKTKAELGRVDVVVNNASEQHVSSAGIEDVPPEQLERVFRYDQGLGTCGKDA